jgi:hypothetical protein
MRTKMNNDTETYYVVNEREVVKQEILAKIRELQDNSYMSDLNGRIALQLIKTFIKYMDKE